MSELLTNEPLIAACALIFSVFTFVRGEQIRKRQEQIRNHLYKIELARFELEQTAAQAAANFKVWAEKEKTPIPSIQPSQQPLGPPQPTSRRSAAAVLQYQYRFHVQNVGNATARDLSIEVRTIDDKHLHRSIPLDYVPRDNIAHWSVDLHDYPQLKLALRWKDNVRPEGDLVVFPPLEFVSSLRPIRWSVTPVHPPGPTGEAPPY